MIPEVSLSSDHVCEGVVWYPAMPLVDDALIADDWDDAYDADPSEWKTYPSKRNAPSFTCYGNSNATRHIYNTRLGMHEQKDCKAMTVRTASKQLPTI